MKDIGKENGAGAMMGDGLYSASLSNKSMARQYGKVSLAVGAVPKNPKVVDSLNAFEIFQQRVIAKWCEENGIEYSARKFREVTDLRTQVMRMGYDGIVITGREMVNYTPGAVRYFDDDDELEQWWLDNVAMKESFVMSFSEFVNEALRHSMAKMDLSDFKYAFHWVNEGLLFEQLYDMDGAHSGPYILRKSNGKKIEMPPLPAERMVFGNRDPDARVTTGSSMGNEVCMTVDPEYAAAGMTGESNVCFVFDLPGLMRDYDVKNLTDNGEAEVRVLRIDDPKKYIVRIFVPTKVWDKGDGWEGFHYRAIKEWFPDSLKPLVVVTRSNKDTVSRLKSMVGGK